MWYKRRYSAAASSLTHSFHRRSSAAPATASVILCTSAILSLSTSTSAMSTNLGLPRVIDSHLHVWANTYESKNGFPYVQEPPNGLKDRASTESLLDEMNRLGVVGALIVQPINHQFDHSYVRQAIARHPQTFKGMMLHDPSLSATEAVERLEELALAGFVGVRFNPYLWPQISPVTATGDDEKQQQIQQKVQQWSLMSLGAGLAVYQRCGELHMPVGIMCFQGLSRHYNDILQLLQQSPDTTMILDHFGFTSITLPTRSSSGDGGDNGENGTDADDAFAQLLALAKYPTVHVKISALFRLGDSTPTYKDVYRHRFLPLLDAYGANRLLYGSDFPYVLEQANGYSVHELVASWCPDDASRAAILGGTAERLFGPWGEHAIGSVPLVDRPTEL